MRLNSRASVDLSKDLIGDLLTTVALNYPNRVAIKLRGGESLTYSELDTRSTRLANSLVGLGVPPHSRLAAWMEDSLEYLEIYMAAAKAGFVVVPINSRFKSEEALYQIRRTRADVLFFSGGITERAAEVIGGGSIHVPVTTGRKPEADVLEYEPLLGSGSLAPIAPPAEDDPYIIGFTSGTTGFPKGAVMTHRSVKNVARTQTAGLHLSLGSVNAHLASMSFPSTVVSLLITHLYVAGTSILMGRCGMDELVSTIRQERATFMYLPTPMIPDFIQAVSTTPEVVDPLVSILHGGSRADADILRSLGQAVGRRYLECWGMTELSGALATVTSIRDALHPEALGDFYRTVGRSAPDAAVEVVDAQRNPVPHDGETVGELAVRSSCMMQGYWEDAAATERVLVDGWYFTGDLGSIDANGYVYISDRRSDLIVSGGMNVYPAELELMIQRLDGVVECAVVGMPHPRWGQAPVAFVVQRPNSHLTEAAVIDQCERNLASYKKPQRVVFVDALPRNASNKVQRYVVREMAETLEQSAHTNERTSEP